MRSILAIAIVLIGSRVGHGKTASHRPVPFAYKCAWLAIHGSTPEKVAGALGIRMTHAAGWEEGIKAAYAGRAFVTPPLEGWILVPSTALFELIDDRDTQRLDSVLASLSRRMNATVLYFGTHRVVELQAWARAEAGHVVRAYAWLGERGEVLLDLGTKTRQEVGLAIPPDEETVLELARRWSIDPRTLDKRLATGPGLVGEIDIATLK